MLRVILFHVLNALYIYIILITIIIIIVIIINISSSNSSSSSSSSNVLSQYSHLPLCSCFTVFGS